MEPSNLRFGGGSADTILHPLVAVAILVVIGLLFVLPRKYAILPVLAAVFLIPSGQVVVLGGVHFTVYRILVIFGLLRLLLSQNTADIAAVPINGIDRAFALCAFFSAVTFAILWMEPQAWIKDAGSLLDAMGGYVVLRFFIRSGEDLRRIIKLMALIAAVLGCTMTLEQVANRNVFGLLGGIPEVPVMRDGQIRAQGTFEVYITAGVFGATLLPLFAWLWKYGGSKAAALAGLVASTAITVASHSSTPLLAYAAAILGLMLWPLRNRMRTLRWGLALALVGLHLVMKAPVWALIARVDLTGSSSGYHRYMLVDNFIRHFSDWWLLGAKEYNSWGWDMWDLSNQYVAYGVTGGLVTLVFFIITISRSFGVLGSARKQLSGDSGEEWLLWCLGAALFSHVVAYFGIGYFDQMQVAWYLLLAMICVAGSEALRAAQMLEVEADHAVAIDSSDWILEAER